MRIESESGDFVAIEGASDPAQMGDLRVAVEVRSRGFSGRIDAWIDRPAWLRFCAELGRLEQRRQGEATVESMSPRELRLAFRSLDGAGHMGVEGAAGYRGVRGETLLSFSLMPFDPSLLPALVRQARELAE
jgi:hypothetical protein